MVEVFGSVANATTTENGRERVTFRIPAISKSLAKQRARGNARLKGMNNFRVSEPQKVGDGDIPGQKIFEIAVTAVS